MLWTIVGMLGLGYAGLCGLVYLQQDSMTFVPSRDVRVTPADYKLEFEDFDLDLGASSVTGWIVRHEPDSPWVLHCHGNGGNISGRIGHLMLLRKAGCNAVVFDYRGYGKSRGKPHQQGLLEDAIAVRQHLLDKCGVEPKKLIYFGESLGGGVACLLAEKHPPPGLILKSTFTSAADRGAELFPYLPVHLLAKTRLNSASRVPHFEFPKLIIHGRNDEVIPFHHGEKLYQLAAEPKKWLEIPGTHNTGPLDLGEEFLETIRQFVQDCCAAAS